MINHRKVRIINRVEKSLKRKSTRRRAVRYGLLAINLAILGGAIFFIAFNSHSSKAASAFNSASVSTTVANPVDQLTSYDIAANVAKVTSLPETTAINNQAQSAKAAMAVNTSDTTVVIKPQIVSTSLKSRKDIQSYTTQSGDTLASIAQKFGVTSDSIRWSNNMGGVTINAGSKLNIPPVNGIVYTVKTGDTPQSLATTYKANVDQIVAYNDAEISGFYPGEQVLIPGGQQQAPATAVTIAKATNLLAVGSFSATYGGNGYDYGYCTWYVATQVAVPTNWGNANTWAYYAALSGWSVSSTPVVGAIAQTSRGYEGHVAVVNAVSADGTQIQFRDMNGLAGFGRVGYSAWVSASTFEHYIYH